MKKKHFLQYEKLKINKVLVDIIDEVVFITLNSRKAK